MSHSRKDAIKTPTRRRERANDRTDIFSPQRGVGRKTCLHMYPDQLMPILYPNTRRIATEISEIFSEENDRRIRITPDCVAPER